MLALNCETVMTLAHSFLARAERGDVLVNVASTLAFLPMPRLAAYSGTKAFVAAFSEALWYEHRPRGVYVMALCPGITATRFQLNAGGHPEDLPSSLTQSPEQVVRFALAAIQRRSGPTRISGLKNRLFTLFARWLPRSSIIAMMGYVSRTWARVPSSKETT
jgi:short-subunit dehydrogenase